MDNKFSNELDFQILSELVSSKIDEIVHNVINAYKVRKTEFITVNYSYYHSMKNYDNPVFGPPKPPVISNLLISTSEYELMVKEKRNGKIDDILNED